MNILVRPAGLLFLMGLLTQRLSSQEVDSHIYQPGIDVLHYDFTLDLPEIGNTIKGAAEIRVRRYKPVDNLRLDLVALRVESVRLNGKPASFRSNDSSISIALPKLAPISEDTLTVSVGYGGPVQKGLTIQTDRSGRWTGFADNWPDNARFWLPTVDHPSDKATVTWSVFAPDNLTVVANGARLESDPQRRLSQTGARKRTLTRWETTRPIPTYLMVIAAAPLSYFDLGLTAAGLSEFPPGVRQSVYVAPELANYLPGPFAKAGEVVEFFSKKVGLFPYEKLAHLQSTSHYGGMENASAIFYGDEVFRERNVSVGLIAHETAHQWFGDAVTPLDWSDLWLSEGFATYFEKLWVQRSKGTAAFLEEMRRLRADVLDARETKERPVIDSLQTDLVALLNANSYQKGAWTLHMLRSLIGDSAFFAGIRSYYDRYKHRTATTGDLCDQMERASGEELGWFFDQWLRRPGYAIVSARWNYVKAAQRIQLEIVQGTRFAPYRFPLAVQVVSEDGTSRYSTLEVEARSQVLLTLPLVIPSNPKSVYLDPGVELLGSFKTERAE